MRDESGQEPQATPKPAFTFGTLTAQTNSNNVFGQPSGGANPFASFGTPAKDATQPQQTSTQTAEALKNPFAAFGQKAAEPLKTPSSIFASSGAQTNGFSASSIFGTSTPKTQPFTTFGQQKDNSSTAALNPFGKPVTQLNGITSKNSSLIDKAEPSRPIFGAATTSNSADASTASGTEFSTTALGSSTTKPLNNLFSSSEVNKPGSTPDKPAKPVFSFGKAQEGVSFPPASPTKHDGTHKGSSHSTQTEGLENSSSSTPNELSGSQGPTKTSTLFSRLAQSQSSAPANDNANEKPKPTFAFDLAAGKAPNASQDHSTSSSIFAPKPSQISPTKVPDSSVPAGVSSISPPKNPGGSMFQLSGSSGNMFDRVSSPAKAVTNGPSNTPAEGPGEKGENTTDEINTPVPLPSTVESQLEDPFTSPAKSACGSQVPRMPTSNIFTRAAQNASISATSPTPSITSNPSTQSGIGNQDTQSAGPSQKIKFSSRGPSNIPSDLDDATRTAVDIGHRLRSLNQGLINFLTSLEPSTDDFGRAIEYYADVRQALGKPLKFHQRASAGEKRKSLDGSNHENVDRAPKRHKSLDERAISQPSLELISASSIFNQSENAPSVVGQSPPTFSFTPKPTEAQTPQQPLVKQTNTPLFGQHQNSIGSTGQTASTSFPNSDNNEAQTSLQPFDKAASTSSIFGRPQNNMNVFGMASSSNSFAPKTLDEQATPKASAKSTSTASLFGQPQVNTFTFGGTPSTKSLSPNGTEELQTDRHDRNKNNTTILSAGTVDKRKVAELSVDGSEDAEASPDDYNQSAKRSGISSHFPVDQEADEENEQSGDDDQDEHSEDESSGAEEDEPQDPIYEPGIDEADEADDQEEESDSNGDDNNLQKAMDGSQKVPVPESSNVGKSLFDRVEPNPNKQNETSDLNSRDTSSAAEVASKPSTSSLFANKTSGSGQFPSFTPTDAGTANHLSTSNLFSKTVSEAAQPSPFTSSTGFSFGSSAKNTSNLFGSSYTFGQKVNPLENWTKPASAKDSPAGTPTSATPNGFPGSGLFGSRPATPDEEAKDKSRPHGTSIFDNAPKFVGDQTFKEGTPIKFANSTAAPTPSVNITAPSPKGKDDEKASLPKPNGGLFGFDNQKSQSGTKPPQTSSGVGFSFANPQKLNPPNFLTPSVTSSANTSRATSPGATDTDSATDGVEEAKTEDQVNLMESRPGEENDDVLFNVARARAFVHLDKVWQHRAYGPLRVLKNKDTGKTRILFRTDPGSQIIVNSLLVPGFEYKATPTGKDAGTITCMVPKEDGTVESWLFKIGKLEQTKELAAVMEANKNN